MEEEKEIGDFFVLCLIFTALAAVLALSLLQIIWWNATDFVPVSFIIGSVFLAVGSSMVFGFSVQHRTTPFIVLSFCVGFMAAAALVVFYWFILLILSACVKAFLFLG